MTPVEIAKVDASWRAASRRRSELQGAIVANLPSGTPNADNRAEWIIETVDRLAPLLVSPTQLCMAATDMAERRGPVHMTDLIADRDALLTGIRDVIGVQPDQTIAAWHQACGIFADVIAALIVNPFCE